jgi:hypothetical protein
MNWGSGNPLLSTSAIDPTMSFVITLSHQYDVFRPVPALTSLC